MASLKDHNAEEPTFPLEGEYSAVIDIRWRLMTQTLAPDLKTAAATLNIIERTGIKRIHEGKLKTEKNG